MVESIGSGTVALPLHTKPSRQVPVGAVRFRESQYIPKVHGIQSDTSARPVSFENVPTGHGVGMDVPSGHQKPAGQTPPIPLKYTRGVLVFTPSTQ